MTWDEFLQAMGAMFCAALALAVLAFAVLGVHALEQCGGAVFESFDVREVCRGNAG